MNLKFLLQIQVETRYQFLKKLYLYFDPNLLELQIQQVHQLLKEMILKLTQIKLIEK